MGGGSRGAGGGGNDGGVGGGWDVFGDNGVESDLVWGYFAGGFYAVV